MFPVAPTYAHTRLGKLRLGILRLGILRLGILRLGILRLGILGIPTGVYLRVLKIFQLSYIGLFFNYFRPYVL